MESASASFPRCVGIDSSAQKRRSRRSEAPRAWSSTDSAPISIGLPARRLRLVADPPRPSQGLIDTSVVIDLDHIDAEQLPKELPISALTMAELAAGPHAPADAGGRARRT